ncbi:hypothetical protein QAD02_006477, partial [Eretmocerus hayati]
MKLLLIFSSCASVFAITPPTPTTGTPDSVLVWPPLLELWETLNLINSESYLPPHNFGSDCPSTSQKKSSSQKAASSLEDIPGPSHREPQYSSGEFDLRQLSSHWDRYNYLMETYNNQNFRSWNILDRLGLVANSVRPLAEQHHTFECIPRARNAPQRGKPDLVIGAINKGCLTLFLSYLAD